MSSSVPTVIWAKQPFPTKITKSIFLAGPTPRKGEGPDGVAPVSWRPEAVQILKSLGFDGHIFIPEPEDGNWRGGYDDQLEWEDYGLNTADVIVFWIPRSKYLPGFTTNDEWGFWKMSGKVILGAPENAEKIEYQRYYATKAGAPVCNTLESTLKEAVNMIGDGAFREGAEVHVPLFIWRTPSFKSWYKSLKESGNELRKARVAWTQKIIKLEEKENKESSVIEPQLLFWALKCDIYIKNEDRIKKDEIILSRSNISSVVLYKKGDNLNNTQVVLVKEFRGTVSNKDGYIYELPGGSDGLEINKSSSSSSSETDPLDVAVKEVEEETGLSIANKRQRLSDHSERQLVSTVTSHKCHLYSMELSDEEFAFLKKQIGKPFLDWSNLGMTLSVLVPLFQ